MHDDVTNAKTAHTTGLGTICKANDCVERDEWGPFFDDFWNEGELAVMFGPPGVGKSVLAVQIADALARGRPMDGFLMPEERHRVLYVDMKLSKGQFAERYTYEPDYENSRRFRHSENLYVGCPTDPAKLCEYLCEMVAEKHISTVIIDDASELRSTYDGTRETLIAMRQLRRLQRELGLSVLVIASSREPGRTGVVRETDLMRSRVLCEAADSAFALGPHPRDPSWRYLIQTRSRSDALRWTAEDMPFCRMEKTEDGNLAFVFDERFVTPCNEDERREIVEIKHRRDEGETYRQISEEMGIPVSRVHRFCQKWRPELEPVSEETVAAQPEEHAAEEPSPPPDEEPPRSAAEASMSEPDNAPKPEPVQTPLNSHEPPPAEAELLDRSTLTGNWPKWISRRLAREITDTGQEILVQTRDERGRPKIYFSVSRKGRVTRWLRDDWGSSGSTLHPPRPTGAGLYLTKRIRSP